MYLVNSDKITKFNRLEKNSTVTQQRQRYASNIYTLTTICILTNVILIDGICIESNYLSCVPSGLPYCEYITTEIESTLTETEHNEVC